MAGPTIELPAGILRGTGITMAGFGHRQRATEAWTAAEPSGTRVVLTS